MHFCKQILFHFISFHLFYFFFIFFYFILFCFYLFHSNLFHFILFSFIFLIFLFYFILFHNVFFILSYLPPVQFIKSSSILIMNYGTLTNRIYGHVSVLPLIFIICSLTLVEVGHAFF